jgi:hypothetical protein
MWGMCGNGCAICICEYTKKHLNHQDINFYCGALKIGIAQQLHIARVTNRHKVSASPEPFNSLVLNLGK